MEWLYTKGLYLVVQIRPQAKERLQNHPCVFKCSPYTTASALEANITQHTQLRPKLYILRASEVSTAIHTSTFNFPNQEILKP
jgi:hypothetical protein